MTGRMRFENGLGMVCDRRRGVGGDPRLVGLNKWKVGILCAETGKAMGEEDQGSALGT